MTLAKGEYCRAAGATSIESVSNSVFLADLGLADYKALSATEREQLSTFVGAGIGDAQWDYLAALDQAVGTTATPQFADLTITTGGSVLANSTSLKILSAPQHKLAFFGGTPAVQEGPVELAEETFEIYEPVTTADPAVLEDDWNTFCLPDIVAHLNSLGGKINNLMLILEQYNLTPTS